MAARGEYLMIKNLDDKIEEFTGMSMRRLTMKLCVACNGEVVHGEFVHDEDCGSMYDVVHGEVWYEGERECVNCSVVFRPTTKMQIFCGSDHCVDEFIDKANR